MDLPQQPLEGAQSVSNMSGTPWNEWQALAGPSIDSLAKSLHVAQRSFMDLYDSAGPSSPLCARLSHVFSSPPNYPANCGARMQIAGHCRLLLHLASDFTSHLVSCRHDVLCVIYTRNEDVHLMCLLHSRIGVQGLIA